MRQSGKEESKEADEDTEIMQTVKMKVELHEIEKGKKYQISASHISGSKLAFYHTWNKMTKTFDEEMPKLSK